MGRNEGEQESPDPLASTALALTLLALSSPDLVRALPDPPEWGPARVVPAAPPSVQGEKEQVAECVWSGSERITPHVRDMSPEGETLRSWEHFFEGEGLRKKLHSQVPRWGLCLGDFMKTLKRERKVAKKCGDGCLRLGEE